MIHAIYQRQAYDASGQIRRQFGRETNPPARRCGETKRAELMIAATAK
jgi:hypothetical protein